MNKDKIGINDQGINNQLQMDLIKRTLQNQVVAEVEKFMEDQIIPKVKEKIHDLAIGAVKNWVINMSIQKEMTAFNNVDKILVQFVEHVIHKVDGPTIKIEKGK